jgi:hypothetical protein
MKFNKSILSYLLEVRDPVLQYKTANAKNKPTIVESEIDKVILELKDKNSAPASNLANRFDEIKQLERDIQERKLKFDEKILEFFENHFDPTDAVYTRVIETASLVIQVGTPSVRKNVKFDEDGFFTEVSKELTPELIEKMKELRKKFTTTKDSDVKAIIKVKPLTEGVLGDFKKYSLGLISKLVSYVKELNLWGKSYDKKVQDIKVKYSL